MKPLLLMLTAAALCRGQTTLTRFFRAGESERQDSHCAQVESRASASGARATLHASKRRLGAVVSYSGIRMNGDERVLRAVIAPYITSDMAGRVGGNPFSITPAEYAFEHIAVETRNGQAADVFLVRPRMNNAGRFTGRLWLDQARGLPVKMSGQISQPASGPFKQVEVDEEYTRLTPERRTLRINTPSMGQALLEVSLTTCRDNP